MAKIINTSQFRGSVEENQGVVVVDFFATWCGPCKMLSFILNDIAKEFASEVEFIKINFNENKMLCEENDATFLKVDIDQSLELAQQFRISTVPTMMIFKDGKPVETLVGFMPKERIVQKVKSHL